ncbi:hypothetical protein Bbelb_268180 [Branchiostoma belcheri]|nr:hypothetical protein Bbelb_268180 [Branchiostoma belcheri]
MNCCVPNRAWGLSTLRDTRWPCPKPCLVPPITMIDITSGHGSGQSGRVPRRSGPAQARFGTGTVWDRHGLGQARFGTGTVWDSQAVSHSVPAQARFGTCTVWDTT